MNKAIWKILIIVIIGGVAFWQFGGSDDSDTTPAQQTENLPINEDNQTSTTQDAPSAIEEAALTAVGSYSGNGTATRSIEGTFLHEVTAELGDPALGDFYEGWLVGPSIVSTGRLVSEGDGQWSLVFTSNEDLSQHDQIVVTEETEANGLDGIPEDHVLEGSF